MMAGHFQVINFIGVIPLMQILPQPAIGRRFWFRRLIKLVGGLTRLTRLDTLAILQIPSNAETPFETMTR